MNATDFDLSSIIVMPPDDGPRYQLGYEMFIDDLLELTEMVQMMDDETMFTEAKVETIKGGMRRTKELTGDALKAYGDTTSGLGDVIHGGTKLSLKLIGLAAKVIRFICKMIAVIPNMITKLIDQIGAASSRALMGITGKMNIYLTADSLTLFDKEIKQEIDHFISICKIFSAGENWTTGLFSEDFKRYNQMKSIVRKLSSIRYEPTSIKLDTEHAKNTYFSPKSNYYATLKSLSAFFTDRKNSLDELGKTLESKIAGSENNGSFYKLNATQRLKAQDSVQMISSFMTIVGKYFQYVQADLLTIQAYFKRVDKSDQKPPDDERTGRVKKLKDLANKVQSNQAANTEIKQDAKRTDDLIKDLDGT